MPSRISILKLAGVFTLGVAVGISAMVAVMVHGPNRVIHNMWVSSVPEHALHAKLLHDGRVAEVQNLIESTFVPSITGSRCGFRLSVHGAPQVDPNDEGIHVTLSLSWSGAQQGEITRELRLTRCGAWL